MATVTGIEVKQDKTQSAAKEQRAEMKQATRGRLSAWNVLRTVREHWLLCQKRGKSGPEPSTKQSSDQGTDKGPNRQPDISTLQEL